MTERPEKHMSVAGIMRFPVPASAPASAPLTLGKEALVWGSQRQLRCPLSLCLVPLRQSLTEHGDPWLWSVQSQRFSCVLSPKAGIVDLYTDFYVVLGSELPPSRKCSQHCYPKDISPGLGICFFSSFFIIIVNIKL